MKLKDAYIEVTERSIDAAEATLAADRHEATAFYSYHAFESLGGAFCISLGQAYSTDHAKKINQFVAATRTHTTTRGIGLTIANIAIEVFSLRNKCLYPQELVSGSSTTPSQHITKKKAEKLLRKVKGVTAKMKKQI